MRDQLGPAELEQFRTRGFVGPFRLMPAEEATAICRRLKQEVLPVRNAVYAHTTAEVMPRLDVSRDRHLDSPLVYRSCVAKPIVDRLIPILGPNILLWRSDFFVQGKGDKPSALHQDAKFTGHLDIPGIEAIDGTMPLNVTVWVAFAKMTPATGGLNVVPGSNVEEIPMVRGEGLFGKSTKIAREFKPEELFPLEMEPGQFVLFDNKIVHGSSPSEADEPRLAISVRFTATETLVNPRGLHANGHGQDLARFGSLLVSGADHHKHNILRAPPAGYLTSAIIDDAAIADLALPAA